MMVILVAILVQWVVFIAVLMAVFMMGLRHQFTLVFATVFPFVLYFFQVYTVYGVDYIFGVAIVLIIASCVFGFLLYTGYCVDYAFVLAAAFIFFPYFFAVFFADKGVPTRPARAERR